MDELKRIYRHALTTRIQALEAALAALASEPAEADASIRRVAHSLRGSGATYGFTEVTRAATAVEEAEPAQLEARVRQLLALLRDLAAQRDAQRVLVVDDDPEIQLLLGTVLGNADVQVESADSAAAARDLIGRERFDLIILDLLLPDGDGRQLLLTLRDEPRNAATPVLVLSAKLGAHARNESLALGARGFLEKPFDPEALAAAVLAQLGGRSESVAGTRPGDGRVVVIVEDDELVAAILKHRLEREGFAIRHYTNGTVALAAMASADFALAVMDVKIPGLDGFQLLEQLRAQPRTAHIPVIMLTALGGERDVVRGLELGANDYVIKPFSPVELMARVHRLLST